MIYMYQETIDLILRKGKSFNDSINRIKEYAHYEAALRKNENTNRHRNSIPCITWTSTVDSLYNMYSSLDWSYHSHMI